MGGPFIRLFIAINFDDRIKGQLFAARQNIRGHAIKDNFSREENFHLTLAFPGKTDQVLVPDIEDSISRIRIPPFEMVFSRLGCFTRPREGFGDELVFTVVFVPDYDVNSDRSLLHEKANPGS
jgi:hypothetical protein